MHMHWTFSVFLIAGNSTKTSAIINYYFRNNPNKDLSLIVLSAAIIPLSNSEGPEYQPGINRTNRNRNQSNFEPANTFRIPISHNYIKKFKRRDILEGN